MSYILLFGMPGGGELFFIILIVVMLFGSKKIPELARGLGKGMREIKNATGDIQREIREGASDLNNLKDKVDIEKQVKDLIKGEKQSNSSSNSSQPSVKGEVKTETTKSEPEFQNEKPSTHPIRRKSVYEKTQVENPSEDA